MKKILEIINRILGIEKVLEPDYIYMKDEMPDWLESTIVDIECNVLK